MRFPRPLSSIGASALALLAAAWLALPHGEAAAALRERLPASSTSLVLDKTPVGTLRAAAGGSAVGKVVSHSSGAGGPVKKQISGVEYEELVLELDLSLDRSLYEWINASWAGNASPKSGALASIDASGKSSGAREFHNAVISETILPALDASSREPAFLTLVLAPERVTTAPNPGGKAPGGASKAKAWVASNFRLEIDGLDTSRVSRVEGLHFKQSFASSSGAKREPTRQPSASQLENFRVTLAESSAELWRAWHEDFVIKGNSSDKSERSGRLLLLGPNLKEELARIELSNLGIVALRPRTAASGVSQLEAELYVERIGLTLGGK